MKDGKEKRKFRCVHSKSCNLKNLNQRRSVVKLIKTPAVEFRRGEWRVWSVRAAVPGSHAVCCPCFSLAELARGMDSYAS
jgi:hypothetical protein